jgi:NADH-quinone oxidoreductase subunit L
MILEEFSAWFVWVLPLIASFFVPVIGKYSDKGRNYFVVAIAAVTAGLAFSLVPSVWSGNGSATIFTVDWIPGLQAGVYIDSLSVLFACLVSFFALIITVYSIGYMKGEEGLTRYYYLILLFIGSMIGLVISDNLIQMFIFWEMVGLCSYSLISFWYKKPESIKAGVKVFIMTRIGDIALLAAIGILYTMFTTFSFHGIIGGIQEAAAAGTLNTSLLVVVAFLVLGGAIAKSAQLPLFTWLYSAMEAPTSVSALLHAATMVKAGIYLLARLILILSVAPAIITALQPLWFPIVTWIGVLTAIIGATLALTTTDIKGVLAYSTISQIGFMMAGLGAAVDGAASVGWFASLFHMISHAFFEGLGFLLAGGIIHAIGTRDMRLMGGLRKTMPISFILMAIMIITTSGLPPFAAFFSKGLIITSVTDIAGITNLGNLLQIILLYATTAITFAYSVRMFSLVFMGKESEHLRKQHVHEAPKIMLIPAMVLAGLCIVWGLSQPLIASFMHFELEHTLIGAFTSLETPIFLSLLVPTGIIAYYTYYKNNQTFRRIAAGKNPLTTILGHAYFFDDVYSGIARGISKFSGGVRHFENVISIFPLKFGQSVIRIANIFHVYFDTKAENSLDKLINVLSNTTLTGVSKMRKAPSASLRNYIAAAVVGFIIIAVLIILTIGV